MEPECLRVVIEISQYKSIVWYLVGVVSTIVVFTGGWLAATKYYGMSKLR